MTIEAMIEPTTAAAAAAAPRLSALALLAVAAVSGLGASSFDLPQRQGNPAAPVSQALREQIAVMSTGSDQSVVTFGASAVERNAMIPLSALPAVRMGGFSDVAQSAPGYGMALKCLTQAIYYEAANEPERGKRGVAQVVLNRVRHPAYPNSVCGVVYEGANARVCQFSFTCDGSLLRSPMARQWEESRRVAAAALAGSVEPEVGTATNYHADYVVPRWAFTLGKIVQIGRHIFYRLPGVVGSPRYFSDRWTGIERIPQLDFQRLRVQLAARQTDDDGAFGTQFVPGLTVPPEESDRHAPIDVGGRLDTTTTWRLTIPDPTEISGGYRRALSDQGDSVPSTAGTSDQPTSAPTPAA
jgi:hypothetical protein